MSATRAGLCDTCLHCQKVKSGRGSTFLLCLRSQSDPRFARYPPLPVLACAGFEENESSCGRPFKKGDRSFPPFSKGG